MARPRVVVTSRLPPDAQARLDAAARTRVLSDDGDVPEATLREAVTDADGLVSMLTDRVTDSLLQGAPALRVVGNCAVGFDNVDVAAATRRGIQVCNTPDVLTDATADLAWALLLAAARRVCEGDRHVRRGDFRRWRLDLLLGRTVAGATLGVVGLGRIGRAVARRARGFDMRILYTQRHRLDPATEAELGATYATLPELLAASDFVSLHAPLTPETRHLLDARALATMKRGAVLVNTARGPLVDEAALADALGAGQLAAAGLDVYEAEPAVHPGLLARDDVVLLPHVGSATVETRTAMAVAIADDVLRVLRGEPPLHPVNRPAQRA